MGLAQRGTVSLFLQQTPYMPIQPCLATIGVRGKQLTACSYPPGESYPFSGRV